MAEDAASRNYGCEDAGHDAADDDHDHEQAGQCIDDDLGDLARRNTLGRCIAMPACNQVRDCHDAHPPEQAGHRAPHEEGGDRGAAADDGVDDE
jgi:hypothetical protein